MFLKLDKNPTISIVGVCQDKLPIIDYFSKITENDGNIPFEKIEDIQKKVTAIRGKYMIKTILKP